MSIAHAERAALRAERRAGRLRLLTLVVAVLLPWLAVAAIGALVVAHWAVAGFAAAAVLLALWSLRAAARRLPDLPAPAHAARASSVR